MLVKRRRLKKSVKRSLIVICGLILISSTISITVAFLTKKNNINNEFILGTVSTSIEETFENNIKENVSIKNTGNVKSFIRASIIITYKDTNNVILLEQPEKDTDYSIDISSSSNWLYNELDGFYYYKLPVEPGNNTDILINECKNIKEYDDKILNVDIVTQSIQAEPIKAVTESWNIDVINNNLSLKS